MSQICAVNELISVREDKINFREFYFNQFTYNKVTAPNPQAPAAAVTNNFDVNLANSLLNIANVWTWWRQQYFIK